MDESRDFDAEMSLTGEDRAGIFAPPLAGHLHQPACLGGLKDGPTALLRLPVAWAPGAATGTAPGPPDQSIASPVGRPTSRHEFSADSPRTAQQPSCDHSREAGVQVPLRSGRCAGSGAVAHVRVRGEGLQLAFAARTEAWARQERVNYNQPSAMLTVWKKTGELAFLNEVSSVPLQQALRHLQGAFANFFSERAKYPRFKSKRKSRASAEYTGSAFTFRDDWLKLAKMAGPLDIVWWCDDPTVKPLAATDAAVGIDVGLDHLPALSTGGKIANPRHERLDRAHLATAQRHCARKEKCSANRDHGPAQGRPALADHSTRARNPDARDRGPDRAQYGQEPETRPRHQRCRVGRVPEPSGLQGSLVRAGRGDRGPLLPLLRAELTVPHRRGRPWRPAAQGSTAGHRPTDRERAPAEC
ncbi:hypothetical protein SAMN05442782_9674 [Streptomyces sp. OK228]|nr:hypothetical protein SAMN05442782_9674 [Streptomyces sp. OK228]